MTLRNSQNFDYRFDYEKLPEKEKNRFSCKTFDKIKTLGIK